jgi:aspartyl protease family protein
MTNSNDSPDNTKHIGRWMIYGMWILLLGLLSLFFNNVLDQQYNPNQHHAGRVTADGIREITLQRNHYGHYVTSGTINGHEVVFLLDTGATDVSVPAKLADRIGLKRGAEIIYQTANGPAPSWLTKLDTVSIGNVEVENIRASINPNFDGDEVLLGMSVLKKLEFTQRGDTLTIRQY